jgi:hypothetical protein
MKLFYKIIYFLYIKVCSTMYRFIKYLSSRNAKYSILMNYLAIYTDEKLSNTDYIKPFKYEIRRSIPSKYLQCLIFTENIAIDVIFLLRMYKTITSIPEFEGLGDVKLAFLTSYSASPFALGKTVIITSKTRAADFVIHYMNSISRLSSKAYNVDNVDVIWFKAYTGDYKSDKINSNNKFKIGSKRAYSTGRSTSTIIGDTSLLALNDFVVDSPSNKDPRRFILPLQGKAKQMTKIAVFDIETFVHNERLYPYAIALQYMKYNKVHKIIYYYEDIYGSIEENSAQLLNKMVNYMTQNCKSYTIFAHNLGKFDGILMISSLFKVLGPHSVIIGRDNSIISMKFKGIKLLDSMRIFPMKLKDLAKEFNVKTQKGEFDHNKVNIDNVLSDLIKDEVLLYIEGDISSLYECMMLASDRVFNKYNFNITDVYSTSSLAMKHFRTSYLDMEGIPLVPRHISDYISESYYGGISQVYKTYGENLYYYDINSLYPWAMTQDMPYEYKGVAYNPKLEDTFGFAYASIYVPESLQYKPLPVRIDESLATPSGHILGVYFTEELKYAKSIGCQITVHRCYQYSKKVIFKKYVEDLYKEKVEAKDSERVFIKLLLNGLYGFFARTDEKYVALFLPLDEAIKQAQIYPPYNIILMDDDKTALLIRDIEPSKEITEATKHNYYHYLDINNSRTKSNRAIASAITGYSRIRIHQFKNICGDVFYSDTDSIITSNKIPEIYLNKDLGFMKDECKGISISEGVFISPKLYGLRLATGEEIIRSRGVSKGELKFDDLMRIHKGEIMKYSRKQLFKSLDTLGMFERDVKGTVEINIPSGKIPIYDDKGYITSYKDVHRTVLTAIKENPLQFKISYKVKKVIEIIKRKLNLKDE